MYKRQQQDLALFRCEAPVGALTVLRELEILGWVVGDQPGPVSYTHLQEMKGHIKHTVPMDQML